MTCPLCGNELLPVGGEPGKEPTTLICQCNGGCTASPEFWEKVAAMADKVEDLEAVIRDSSIALSRIKVDGAINSVFWMLKAHIPKPKGGS